MTQNYQKRFKSILMDRFASFLIDLDRKTYDAFYVCDDQKPDLSGVRYTSQIILPK